MKFYFPRLLLIKNYNCLENARILLGDLLTMGVQAKGLLYRAKNRTCSCYEKYSRQGGGMWCCRLQGKHSEFSICLSLPEYSNRLV